jgi:hypothetical protein
VRGRTALLTTRKHPSASGESLLMIAMNPFTPETSTTRARCSQRL